MTLSGHHTMLGGVKLPYDAEVEFIEQTGDQYIDTRYPMSQVRREEITVDWSEHSTTHREFMAGAASGSYLIELSATGFYGTAPKNLSSIQVGTKDKIRWEYSVGQRPALYINDVFAIWDTLIRVPKGTIKTGGVGTPGVNYPKVKIYGLKIYTDDGVLVFDGLPVRKDGVGELFDRVSGTFATRYGTFVVGPDASATRGGGISAYA